MVRPHEGQLRARGWVRRRDRAIGNVRSSGTHASMTAAKQSISISMPNIGATKQRIAFTDSPKGVWNRADRRSRLVSSSTYAPLPPPPAHSRMSRRRGPVLVDPHGCPHLSQFACDRRRQAGPAFEQRAPLRRAPARARRSPRPGPARSFRCASCARVERPVPLGDDDRRDSVANQVRQRARSDMKRRCRDQARPATGIVESWRGAASVTNRRRLRPPRPSMSGAERQKPSVARASGSHWWPVR